MEENKADKTVVMIMEADKPVRNPAIRLHDDRAECLVSALQHPNLRMFQTVEAKPVYGIARTEHEFRKLLGAVPDVLRLTKKDQTLMMAELYSQFQVSTAGMLDVSDE